MEWYACHQRATGRSQDTFLALGAGGSAARDCNGQNPRSGGRGGADRSNARSGGGPRQHSCGHTGGPVGIRGREDCEVKTPTFGLPAEGRHGGAFAARRRIRGRWAPHSMMPRSPRVLLAVRRPGPRRPSMCRG
jgi:hypothetical protein